MTAKEVKDKLARASELIFEIEREFPLGEFPRLHGYRARIELGKFEKEVRDLLTVEEAVVLPATVGVAQGKLI